MDLTEIIFRLFAWARPLLWYYHRLGNFLRAAVVCLQDDEYCLWLFDTPEARASFESKLVDAERCLEIAIAYRVREILGLAMPVRKLGIGGFHRLHSPTSLLRPAARFDRLVARYNDIERLAQLRAARLKREAEAAPVLLVADHRPQDEHPAIPGSNPSNLAAPDPSNPDPSNFQIRGPPWPGSVATTHHAPTRSTHLRERGIASKTSNPTACSRNKHSAGANTP